MAKDKSITLGLIEQRIRNRIINAIELLALGNEGVRRVGFVDYFELFYDWVLSDADDIQSDVMSTDEKLSVLALKTLLNEASDNTPQCMSDSDFIKTGWPKRIQLAAQEVLALMLKSGKSDEEREE